MDSFYDIYTNALYYDDVKNIMTDEDGFVVYDIYKFVTPSQLHLFKEKKRSMIITDKTGTDLELVYNNDSDYLDYSNYPCRELKEDIWELDTDLEIRYRHLVDWMIIIYSPERNQFYDATFGLIDNIFLYLTPNDLMIFRADYGNCVFPHRSNFDILVEITVDHDGELEREYYGEERSEVYCDVWPGVRCRISGSQEVARDEVCKACRG